MVCFKKNKLKISAFFFLLLLIGNTAIAAKISGKITDKDGEALSFANVIVKGTSMGTSANADGYYTLTLPEGNYQIQAQYIGFKQAIWSVTLTANQNAVHDFKLILQGYDLKDFVIKSGGEDPAYRVIRNAIKRREFHLRQMQSFQTRIYLKGALRNRFTPDKVMGFAIKDKDKSEMNNSMGLDSAGKGVLYLCEQFAEYYTKGNKEKLIIRSVKESGNPSGVGLGSVPSVINFYKNNVLLFNKNEFVSPIASAALNYYNYQLEGTFEEDGRKIYKINVTPKRNFERCFFGTIYIANDDWAIHSTRLWVTKKQGLDMLDSIKTEQIYVPLEKDLWVIKNQVYYPTINLFGFDVSGNFVTVYDNQKINQPIADSIFNNKTVVTYLREANKRDSNYWLSQRPIKLEADESKNYDYRDSLYIVETDPNRIDSFRKIGNKAKAMNIILWGSQFNSKEYKTSVNISPLFFDVNFNTIEGLNYSPSFALKHKIDSNKTFSWENDLRYGFSNAHFNAKSLIRLVNSAKNWTNKFWGITIMGGKYISQFNNQQPAPELPNSYGTLMQQRNFFKIYEHWVAGFRFQKNYGNGFKYLLSAQYEHRLPLENTTDFSFVQNKGLAAFTENVGYKNLNIKEHKVFILKAMISYQPGVRYVQFPDKKVSLNSKAPIFELNIEKGIPNIVNSSSDYTKWDFQIRSNIDLNRKGNLAITAVVGGFLDAKNVPLPDMMQLYGNRYHIASPYLQSFQLAGYYDYNNTAKWYGKLHTEYKLNGFISNKIPLLKQAQWYFVMGTNTFFVSKDQYYTEAFLGLDNIGLKIFRGIRIDFVKGWDAYKQDFSDFRIGWKLNGIKIKTNTNNEAVIF